MMYQVPVDLIERARILLRNEADLESYNPSDPSFPSLPSVEAVIAGFDPSPDCPRCEHCRGKLLRGSQSLICLYCGREPRRDCPPEPLSFKSTIGYRWLVDSLGLDGSEIIEASEEGKQSNKGWKSLKDEISLSEFLSNEIKWPVESERFGVCAADDLRNHEKGVLLNFNHSLSEELPIVEAMSNRRSIDVKGKIGNTFSAWEADFQAASCVDESSQPSKLSVDNFEEIETSRVVSSSAKLHIDAHKEMSVSAGNDLFGAWNDVSVDNLQQTGTVLTADKISEKDEYSSTMWDDFTVSQHNHGDSGSVEFVGGWLNDEGGNNFMSLSSSQGEKEANSKEARDDIEIIKDETFDSLSNLTSSASRPESKSGNEDMTQAWNDISDSNVEEKIVDQQADTAKDEDVFNSWGDFSGSSVLQSTQQQNNEAFSEGHMLFNDWTSDSKGTSEYQLKVDEDFIPAAVTEIDDSFDAWSEFTSSTALPKVSQVGGKQDTAGNDPFDAWSLLITSSSQNSNQNVNSIESSLFNSSENQKVAEFDSNLQPFLFPDAANGSASTVLDHFRMNDAGTESSTSQNDEPHASGQMSWKKPIDAEALISQMHDLSFMLESNLSVSKNVD